MFIFHTITFIQLSLSPYFYHGCASPLPPWCPLSWSHHGSPAFSLVCVCVLYFPVCIIPPVSLPMSVLCVCMWARSPSTGSTRWIHSSNQPSIKPLDSLLLVTRSFLQSMWLFASWLLSVFAPVLCGLACVANTPVFFPPCLRLLCLRGSLVFCFLPAWGLARQSPALLCFCSVWVHWRDRPHCTVPQHRHHPAENAASRYPHPRSHWWLHKPCLDPRTTQHPSPLHLFACLNIKKLVIYVL